MSKAFLMTRSVDSPLDILDTAMMLLIGLGTPVEIAEAVA